MLLAAPRGLEAIRAAFGEPGEAICSAGRCRLPKPLPLGWKPETSVSSFACHKLLEDNFTEVFQRIHSEGFWGDLKSFDGAYNYRALRGATRLSLHSWGVAIDLNAEHNKLGTEGSMSKDVVRIFMEEGFLWGGHFVKRKDPMHFQYASGY